MEERAIHISSKNREKRGTSRPGDFTIKFNPPLKHDPEMKHEELALDRLSMTYPWYNIRSDYKNNAIKYTHDKGVSWQTISLQMKCIPTMIPTIIFINTWFKKIITQLTQAETNSFTSISLLYYQPTEC